MFSSIGRTVQHHITRCINDSHYAAKTLLYSSIALGLCSHVADSFQLGKNKKIEEDKRKYLKYYQLTEGFVSAGAQAAVGLAVIHDKTQNFIIKNLSKTSKKLAKTLQESIVKKNVMKLSSLIAAVVMAKRILVPFIVTPLASLIKKEINPVAKEDENRENIFETDKHKADYDD